MEVFLLRGLCTDFLFHKLTTFGLQCRGSSLKNTKDIWGKSELISFRIRALVRALFSEDRSVDRHQFSFVEPSPDLSHQQEQVGTESEISINLTNTICSWDHTKPNSQACLTQLLPMSIPWKQPISAYAVEFPKISQRITKSSSWCWHGQYLLLSSPQPRTSGDGSQLVW